MKEYIREKTKDQKFDLHDSSLINFLKRNQDLFIESDYGFVDLEKNQIVDRNIRIEDVSFEDSYVYIMDYGKPLCRNLGKFSGEKMSLEKFIKDFGENIKN